MATPTTAPPVGEDVNKMFDGTTQKYYNPQDFYSGGIITPGQWRQWHNRARHPLLHRQRRPRAQPELLHSRRDQRRSLTGPGGLGAGLAGRPALPDGRNPAGLVDDPTTQFNQTLYFSNSLSYTSYRVRFSGLKNYQTATGMQIGDVQLLTDVSTFHVGGPNNSPGLFEFDLSPYLQYANQTSLLEKVQLQLDYQNATIVNGQKLSVFIGNTESDGVVSAERRDRSRDFRG